MKLPWKREPRDLVGEEVVAAKQRAAATTPNRMTEADWARAAEAGILFLPEEMTAAGGWCSPSEVSYAMSPSGHPASAVPLVLELPAVQVRRGGVPWPDLARLPASRPMPAPREWLPPEPVFKDATAP